MNWKATKRDVLDFVRAHRVRFKRAMWQFPLLAVWTYVLIASMFWHTYWYVHFMVALVWVTTLVGVGIHFLYLSIPADVAGNKFGWIAQYRIHYDFADMDMSEEQIKTMLARLSENNIVYHLRTLPIDCEIPEMTGFDLEFPTFRHYAKARLYA